MTLLLVRTKCKTCPHSFDPRELLAGLCSYCLLDRLEALNGGHISQAVLRMVCEDCNRPVLAGAYMHWDATARDFSYLCLTCADKAIAKAGQYRNTPFGYAHKAQ